MQEDINEVQKVVAAKVAQVIYPDCPQSPS